MGSEMCIRDSFNRNTLNWFLGLVYKDCQPRIVHRLDANTTGVVVYAKKRAVANALRPQFKEGKVSKTYLAKVHGTPAEQTFDCDVSIGREPDRAGTRKVDANGDHALTQFELLSHDSGQSLLACYPKTGRTNQIRIHLTHLGLPIVGDSAYGKSEHRKETQTLGTTDPPMCLHAWKLEFDHPDSGHRVNFEAPKPTWT